MTIWIVDDDPSIRQVVRQIVEKEGFEARDFDSAEHVVDSLQEAPELILLDVMMPGKKGTELCRDVRSVSQVPIIFLSTEGEAIDRVVGLELGADDYLVKPFHPKELAARINAVLRRHSSSPDSEALSEELEIGSLFLDEVSFKVTLDGTDLELTKIEFYLLKTLMSQPTRVFTRDGLMSGAYEGIRVSQKTIDSHIRRLRSSFQDFDIDPVRTVRGVGYALNVSAFETAPD